MGIFRDLRENYVIFYAFDAVQAGIFAGVGLGNGNDGAVAGAQTEAELAAFVPVELEFGVGKGCGFLGLVLDAGLGGVFDHAVDALAAGGSGFVYF